MPTVIEKLCDKVADHKAKALIQLTVTRREG